MNQRGLVNLPRNWRVITVASLTTLGLAYGAGQPVRGEWWSLPKAKSEATKVPATKPVATENGFASTIHRLMSDARLYADKGDLDKAVQLAERAAKISEASSQLLGPASDCSPEQTAQFADDLRARRDAVAKRTAPARVARTVAAAAPKPQPTAPRSLEIPSESPAQLLEPFEVERSVAERAIAKRAATEPPAEIVAESRESELAWAEELPPTPAPEPEPLNKPIKFRRSVLARAGHSIDADADDSRSITEEVASPSSADSVIAEMLDAEFTDGLPIELPQTASDAVTPHTETSLNETISSSLPAEANLPSLNGEIQPVAAEDFANEPPPQPAALGPKSGWEDEAFAEELLLGKSSPAKSDGSSTEPASTATKTSALPFPDDGFPVQRVVQLRRRLETAASLNPGGAYTMPASPSTEPARAVSPSPKSETPELPKHAPSIESSEPTDDSMTSTNSTEHLEKQTAIRSEPTLKGRQVVRLREHRVLPDHVRTALLQAAALPPSPAARRRIVGYSEPMLWQSASEPDSVLPTLSFANGVGNGTSGSHNAAAASPLPDLRDLAHSTQQSGKTHRAGERVIPAATVVQTGFRSIELPADSIQLSEPSDPALSSANKGSAKRSTLSGPTSVSRSDLLPALDSNAPSSRTAKRPTDANHKPQASKSKASHEVSRQSFAVIEPLAAALQLPIATTASLVGGAGLALLGLGLLLVRAAIRWRHS